MATSLTVGGQALSLNLPAGPYLSLEATGATLRALGQTISGDFTLTQVATGPGPDGIPGNQDDPKAVALAIANGSIGLGDGKVNFLTLSQVSGDLLLINIPAGTSPGHPGDPWRRRPADRHRRAAEPARPRRSAAPSAWSSTRPTSRSRRSFRSPARRLRTA